MCDKKIIKFNDFSSYLNRQSGNHVCPICGHDEWDLHTAENAAIKSEDGKNKKYIVPTLPGSPRIDPLDAPLNQLYQSPALNILIMTCNNCAYMNLFNYQKVKEKLEQHSEDKGNTESRNESTEG